MSRKKAAVAGHICLDITPVFPRTMKTKGIRVEDVLSPSGLIRMDGVRIAAGGAVNNTGIAMKLMGADVQLMGKIGNDTFGQCVLNVLGQYGVSEEEMLISESVATSYSVVLAIPGIDRIFLHDPGANDTFCYDDLQYEKLRDLDLFHFGYPPLMAKLFENDGEQLAALLKKVKEQGPAVSLDLAQIDPASEAGAADWGKILERSLPYVDFFVPSAEEICYILDRDLFTDWKKRSCGSDVAELLTMNEVQHLGRKCLELGAAVVLIKCGAAGIYYCTGEGEKMQLLCRQLGLDPAEWVGKEGFEQSYQPEAVLSATGAGDTCIAAFLTSVLNEEPLSEAMHLAAAAGACCVEAYDALSGLKTIEEMKEKIRRGWKKG